MELKKSHLLLLARVFSYDSPNQPIDSTPSRPVQCHFNIADRVSKNTSQPSFEVDVYRVFSYVLLFKWVSQVERRCRFTPETDSHVKQIKKKITSLKITFFPCPSGPSEIYFNIFFVFYTAKLFVQPSFVRFFRLFHTSMFLRQRLFFDFHPTTLQRFSFKLE